MDERDFDRTILEETAHRPWPMPAGPWAMTQTWHDLLFAHWPIDKAALRAKIPPGIELDLYDGEAWVGIVPFYMTNVSPRGVPALPWISAFAELNVRTYVSVGRKRGVYFFSLDAGNPVAVGVARELFHLPYHFASMRVDLEGGTIRYDSSRRNDECGTAEFKASYAPTGPVFHARQGTLEYFLTERYCLYTVNRRGQVLRVEIHHPPWPLQTAEAVLEVNTMADAAGLGLSDAAPHLLYAKRQDMVAWLPERAAAEAADGAAKRSRARSGSEPNSPGNG